MMMMHWWWWWIDDGGGGDECCSDVNELVVNVMMVSDFVMSVRDCDDCIG